MGMAAVPCAGLHAGMAFAIAFVLVVELVDA